MSGGIRWLGRIGAEQGDAEDVRLAKSLLVYLSALIAALSLFWGALYLAFGEPLGGAIPLFYSLFSFASLAVFAATRRYRLYQASQLVLILLLPAILTIQLGGYASSSAVVLWAALGPLGALMWATRREAAVWFGIFVALVIVVGLWPTDTNNLPEWLISAFFAMNIVGPTACASVSLVYFVGERDRERAKSEALLLNVLPKEVAAELREGPHTIARHHDAVSILFADVVNFTPLSEELDPEVMLELLDGVFTYFDGLVEAAGVEKVRTIGDAYMVSAGAPTARADHAEVLVAMGLEMQRWISERDWGEDRPLQVRVGINSGPAVAGVIGRVKFQYDIWGDTVNLAARMESHGVAGRVQITDHTHALLEGRFDCEDRGVISVKGKADMRTWLVRGPVDRVDGGRSMAARAT